MQRVTHSYPSNGVRNISAFWQNNFALIDRAFYLFGFLALCVLLVLPLWQVTYLPMGDLPDHAAQIRVILDYQNYQDEFRIQWFTPYLVGYALTLLFASFLSIPIALKLVLTLCLLAMPIATAWLLRALKGNKYWVIVIFPSCFSYAFYWGFLSYTVATTIAFFCIALITQFSLNDLTLKRKFILFFASVFLFFSHALAWAMVACLVPLIFWQNRSLKEALRCSVPFFLILPIVVIWLSKSGEGEHGPQAGHYVEHYFNRIFYHASYFYERIQVRTDNADHWPRVRELFSLTVGRYSSLDYLCLSFMFLFWPLFTGARLKRGIKCWLPLLAVILTFMLVPYWIFDTAYVYGRYAVFLFPVYFFIFKPKDDEQSDMASGSRDLLQLGIKYVFVGMAPLIVVTLLVGNIKTFGEFKGNDHEFSAMLKTMEPNKQSLSLIFNHDSPFRFSASYTHFGGWVQAVKGGKTLVNFSFDESAKNVPVRYKGELWEVPDLWNSSSFRWSKHKGDKYDYFIIRSTEDRSKVFGRWKDRVELVSHNGNWWLYKNISKGF